MALSLYVISLHSVWEIYGNRLRNLKDEDIKMLRHIIKLDKTRSVYYRTNEISDNQFNVFCGTVEQVLSVLDSGVDVFDVGIQNPYIEFLRSRPLCFSDKYITLKLGQQLVKIKIDT